MVWGEPIASSESWTKVRDHVPSQKVGAAHVIVVISLEWADTQVRKLDQRLKPCAESESWTSAGVKQLHNSERFSSLVCWVRHLNVWCKSPWTQEGRNFEPTTLKQQKQRDVQAHSGHELRFTVELLIPTRGKLLRAAGTFGRKTEAHSGTFGHIRAHSGLIPDFVGLFLIGICRSSLQAGGTFSACTSAFYNIKRGNMLAAVQKYRGFEAFCEACSLALACRLALYGPSMHARTSRIS